MLHDLISKVIKVTKYLLSEGIYLRAIKFNIHAAENDEVCATIGVEGGQRSDPEIYKKIRKKMTGN